MNVKVKKVLLGMAMMLGLTLLPISTQTVFAEGGSGMPVISAESDDQTTTKDVVGGPSKNKVCVYVSVSIADSETSPSTAVGHGLYLMNPDYYGFPGDTSSDSKINGAKSGPTGSAPWPSSMYWCVGGQNASGGGKAITNWVANTKTSTGSTWASKIALACGVTEEQIRTYMSQNKCIFLNFEGQLWCNDFSGMSASSKGDIISGLAYGIGSKISDNKTLISRYLRGSFPKGGFYDIPLQGIKTVSPTSDLISKDDMMDKTSSWGICSICLNQKNQVVLCVEDGSGVWSTQYLSAGDEYTIQNPYQGAEFVEATFSTKKSPLSDPNASYETVCGSGAPNRATEAGAVKFNIPNKEVALFVHYKGDIPDPTVETAHLYSWETAYIMPKFASQRDDGAEVDNAYTLQTHIQEMIDKVSKYTRSCPKNKNYTHANGATGKCVIDKTTCRGSESWSSQKYGVKADLGDFPNASWNLYRESVSGTKWDTYNDALGDTDKWQIDTEVDPQFSYYLTRSHLEDVSACPEGGEVAAALNIKPEYKWETDWVGREGVGQKPNTEGSHSVSDYSYTFTAYGYELKIYYHFECGGDDWETGEYGDWDNDPETDDTYKTTDSETHPKGHKYNASDGDWSSIANSTKYEENSYTPDPWDGNTGDGHIEDKYKTMLMPSGQNTSADNTVDDWTTGMELQGNFAKGGSFNYKAKTGQLVGSQFQGVTFSIYPEVKMSVWTSTGGADKYTDPEEKVCYVMGEYARNYTPPITHSYKVKLTTGSMEGMGTLASAADGSAAKKVLDNATGHQDNNLGVTAMGTTFEIATTSQYQIDIYTVGCNIDTTTNEGSAEANSAWGNVKQSVLASHEEYVSSILAGMQQEIIMKLEKGTGTSQSFDPVYYKLLTTESDSLRNNDPYPEIKSVKFVMGTYDTEGAVQTWCGNMWSGGENGKSAYTDTLQYAQILDTMFLSATDDENGSKPYSEGTHAGEALGDGVIGNAEHWYDEESKNKMQVEYYKTTVTFGLMNADDKMDWNLLNQNVKSRLKNATDSIHVTFYTRLFNDQDFTAADGYTWGGHTGTYGLDHLTGCDFHVINETTAQMKSN